MADKVFSVRIDGIEQSISSLQEAEQAIEQLNESADQLEQQLADASLGESEFQQLNQALQETRNSLDAAAEAAAEFDAETAATTRTLESMEAAIEAANEQLAGLDVGSEEAAKLRKEIVATEKELESLNLFAEAAALGFRGIGEETNTIEGLNVAVTALQAQLATLDDPLEQANVEQQIREIQFAIEDAEAQAKQGIFPPGSIGSLTAEIEQLELALRRAPAGSAEFSQIQKRLQDVQLQADTATLSLEDQRQVIADLGGSAVGSFGAAVGALEGFGVESEAAQEALAALEAAFAAIEAVRAIQETAQLARQAQIVGGLQAQTAATGQLGAAQTAQAGAATTAATAQTGFATASNTATGGVRALGAALLANPLFLIAGVLAGVVLAVNKLSKRFEFFADIVETVEAVFSGVFEAASAGFEFLTNNLDTAIDLFTSLGSIILKTVLAPLTAVNEALLLFGVDTGIPSITEDFKQLGETAGEVGGAIADGFEKGFDKARKLQDLFRREQLREFEKLADERAEIELGSTASTEEARRDIRLKGLETDRQLALERLQIEQDLTDEEVQLLRDGNLEKLKENQKFVNARGELNEELLAGFEKVQEAETAILQEQEERRLALIADRIASLDNLLTIEQNRLAEVENFRNEELAAEADFNTRREQLQLQRQAGEFRNAQEFNQQLQILEQERQAALDDIASRREEFERELARTRRENLIEDIQFETDRRRELGELSFNQEKANIDQVRQLRLESIEEELAALDLRQEADQQRAEELARERVVIERETQQAILQATLDGIDRRAEAEQRLVDSRRTQLELLQREEALQSQLAAETERRGLREVAIRQELAANLTQRAAALREINAIEQQAIERAKVEREEALAAQLQEIDLKREELAIEEEVLQAQLAAGAISQQQFDNAQAVLNQRRESLELAQQEAEVQANIDLQQLEEQAVDAARTTGQAILDELGTYLDNPLNAEFQQFLNNTFGQAGPLIGDLSRQLGEALAGLGEQLFANQLASFDEQLEEIDERAEAIQENIDTLTEAGEERAQQAADLQAQLAEAQGNERAALIAQIENEQSAEAELNKQLVQQEKELQKQEKEREAIENKRRQAEIRAARVQKAVDIGKAIANTALGITRTIADVPKVDFGVSTAILTALYGALGAAQVATIAATPIPARKGGVLKPGGGIRQFAEGGIVDGPSHEAGGVRGTGAFAGIEVEGGEGIIPKAATARNMPVVEALIKEGSRRTFNVFRDGGFLPAPGQGIVQKFQTGGVIPPPSEALAEDLAITSPEQAAAATVNDAVANLPAPVVSVVDIAEGQNRAQVIDDVATV